MKKTYLVFHNEPEITNPTIVEAVDDEAAYHQFFIVNPDIDGVDIRINDIREKTDDENETTPTSIFL